MRMKNFSKLLFIFLIGMFTSVSFAQDTGDQTTSEKTSVVLVTPDNSGTVMETPIQIVAPSPPGEFVDFVKVSEDGNSAFAPGIPDYDGRLPECEPTPYFRSYKLDLFSVLNKPPLHGRLCSYKEEDLKFRFIPLQTRLPYSRHVQA